MSSKLNHVSVVMKALNPKRIVITLVSILIASGLLACSNTSDDNTDQNLDRLLKEPAREEPPPAFVSEPATDQERIAQYGFHARSDDTLGFPSTVKSDSDARKWLDSETKKYFERPKERQGPIEIVADRQPIDGTCFEGCLLPIIAVSMNRSRISPEGLKAISSLPELVSLQISSNFLLGEGLAYLAQSPKLEILQVTYGLIQPQSLQALSKSRSLKILRLIGCSGHSVLEKLDGSALEYFTKGGAPNLRQLYWSNMSVSSESLKALTKLPSLKELRLIQAQLKDADLRDLADLSVETLDLNGNPYITAKGLIPLQKMKHLKRLILPQKLNVAHEVDKHAKFLLKKELSYAHNEGNYPNIKVEDAELIDGDLFGSKSRKSRKSI